ncbi:MAG: aminodeoxychorismate/anthranilate synthase component II [Candidatus Omnitrophica bacterium]|nr:aminodeoxychorismate/anthranilate synthase component II [Candidatus Omnitrophota bacterium]MCB9746911.1 aminodeoxychorismate/anthranilate synthase component II [Candidatus Omnitrophota bacterium]
MILMIDNYDSFTYNLVQYFGELGADLRVFRNDALTIEDIRESNPEKIVISPGPGRPESAGISVEIIKEFKGKIPIFGVCLGHQCIGYAHGAEIVQAKKLMHGKTSQIRHNGQGLYKDIENPFEATRYHSLVIKPETLSGEFEITARSDDGEIMGICHKSLPLWGVQYHPESILTKAGKKILDNFLKM